MHNNVNNDNNANIRAQVLDELTHNATRHPRVLMLGEAVKRLSNEYQWLSTLSDVDSIYTALRERLHFSEHMQRLIASQCELRTAVPTMEREMLERSDSLS